MIRHNPDNKFPSINKTTYIDPTATIIGNVKIGKNVFVGPGAVVKADEPGSSITVKDNCNIQDRVIIHALENSSVLIDKNTSLAHGCIIHGPCKIGKNCFIGFGSVVFKSSLANGVMLKHLAVVEGVNISKNNFVPSGIVVDSQDKAKRLKTVPKPLKAFSRGIIKTNLKLKKGYLKNATQ